MNGQPNWAATPFNYGQLDSSGSAYVNKVASVIPAFGGTMQSFMHYPIDIAGKHVLSASWNGFVYTTSGGPHDFSLFAIATQWDASQITWASPPVISWGDKIELSSTTDNTWISTDVTSWANNWVNGIWQKNGILVAPRPSPADPYPFIQFAADEASGIPDPAKCGVFAVTCDSFIAIDYNSVPTQPALTAPSDGQVVMTSTPTLTTSPSTDADGDPLEYWFRLATNPDGTTGQIINSGWQPGTSWTVPPGSLQDGATYYTTVYTKDAVEQVKAVTKSFRVNLRLGNQAVSPNDGVGPVTVNLANGNAVVSTSSPTVATVGGSMGLSYTYNSKTPAEQGLRGYYNVTGFPTSMVRTDPQVSFDWGTGAPNNSMFPDDFEVKWVGYITAPFTAGNWHFGLTGDDSATVKVNGNEVVTIACCPSSPQWGPATWLNAGQTVPIEVTYREVGGGARVALMVSGAVDPQVVPADWLSTTAPSLPKGWQLSGGPAGGLSYASVNYTSSGISLVEPSGVAHPYIYGDLNPAALNPGYHSIDGDNAWIAKNPTNIFELLVTGSDGIQYRFDVFGKLLEATSATDDLHPAATKFSWDESSKRLSQLKDPVSGKEINLTYSTGGGTCPAGSGFDTNVTTGLLCQVGYPDGTVTKLFYVSCPTSCQLARIEDPGGEVTDFAYSGGLLTKVRDPLAADAVAAGMRANDDTTRTVIAYDLGQVSRVTSPEPTPGALRPAHWYSHPDALSTLVHVDGVDEGAYGFARMVRFDVGGRVWTDDDATGVATVTTWHPTKDLVASTVSVPRGIGMGDPNNLKSTVIYDAEDRATDNYGPAPRGWFGDDGRPTGPNAGGVPRSITNYDEGIVGLAATYWNNTNMSGTPVAHGTGFGGTGDPYIVGQHWEGSPAPNVNADQWSVRLTGEVQLRGRPEHVQDDQR